jgi:hypothetical protein
VARLRTICRPRTKKTYAPLFSYTNGAATGRSAGTRQRGLRRQPLDILRPSAVKDRFAAGWCPRIVRLEVATSPIQHDPLGALGEPDAYARKIVLPVMVDSIPASRRDYLDALEGDNRRVGLSNSMVLPLDSGFVAKSPMCATIVCISGSCADSGSTRPSSERAAVSRDVATTTRQSITEHFRCDGSRERSLAHAKPPLRHL